MMIQDNETRPTVSSRPSIPKLGPEPTLLSRKEFDALYEMLEVVLGALKDLSVDAIVTGGSLLGAIRQHSILFCDDDIDLTIIDYDGSVYESIIRPKLQDALGGSYLYQIRPWEGGDRIRPKRMSNVFLDLFVLRKFDTIDDLRQLIGFKKNGQTQSEDYVQGVLEKMIDSAGKAEPLCPFWHFTTRKAVEMWTKEVYRESELFPLDRNLKMGPVTGICGPRMPVRLLKRAFGDDCFDVYFPSFSHHSGFKSTEHHQQDISKSELPPLISAGGTWESGVKTPLKEEHYLPIQPISRAARRPTLHSKEHLLKYLECQSLLEEQWTSQTAVIETAIAESDCTRPKRTVYMDGVFDLFHIGHLEAIRQCSKMGRRVIIGVTGDLDATGYKRQPIVPETERCAIIHSLKEVDEVVCPCPLVVTEEFMSKHDIDLVVHGFANDADANRQKEFFEVPMKAGKFSRIPYYHGMSTTDRIKDIQSLLDDEANTERNDDHEHPKPQWFGTALSTAVGSSQFIPFDPFPLNLREKIEPHISKARQRRKEALRAIREATGNSEYDTILALFQPTLAKEAKFSFDESIHNLSASLLQTLGLQSDFDLSTMHHEDGQKNSLLQLLTTRYESFQKTFDQFVRDVCAPQMARLFPCDEIYYQAFPCLRIVQPDEFSIGPHSDVAYGHHPCSVNFYVPLTKIGGTASLFLESRHGAEDWHPIEGSYGKCRDVYQFQ
jgi:cytidyltransferase-like protein